MKNYIAKQDKQITLLQHTMNVVSCTEEILVNAGITDEKIIGLSKVAAAVHDCGKTMNLFQEWVTKCKEGDGPRHNEVGFALLECLIDKTYGFFGDNEFINLIRYTTLYHHEPINHEAELSEYYSVDEINEVASFYNDLFVKCGISHIIKFHKNITDDNLENGYLIGSKKTFDFISSYTDRLGDAKRILSIFEIIFNVVRYADYIVSAGKSCNYLRPNSDIDQSKLIIPNHFDKNRWDEQVSVANQAFEKSITVMDATMGWGKTLSGLNFLLHSKKRGFWVCPDNGLADATYHNIVRDLKECGVENLKVSLLLGGNWRKNNWGGNNISVEDADIIVTNIDTCVNGFTRNARKVLSYEILFSNCIFDEYHEYANTDSPLLARFLSVINARKHMGDVKTLLLSGTAINKGYVDVQNVIEAGINLAQKKKVVLNIIDSKEYYTNCLTTPNSVHINTSIKTCQRNFEKGNFDYCYHSLFDDSDLENIVQEIMSHNGKNSKLPPSTISSTSVFSRGMDVSFPHSFLINPTPEMIEQILGRTGNRWDFDAIAHTTIVLDKKLSELYIYQDTGVWEKYYSKYIEHLKPFITNEPLSAYDLKKIRLDFLEKSGYYKKIINNNFKKSLVSLSHIIFSKGSPISENDSNTQHIKDGVEVRGDSLSRFFAIQKDNEPFGTLSGPINIPDFRFGGDVFRDLSNSREVMTNIIKYFEQNPDIAEKYKIKKRSLKSKNLFRLLMDKAKCSDTPFPLLCDYHYNSKIGFYKKSLVN